MPVPSVNRKDPGSSRKRCVKVFLGGSKFAKGLCTGSEERQVFFFIIILCTHFVTTDFTLIQQHLLLHNLQVSLYNMLSFRNYI